MFNTGIEYRKMRIMTIIMLGFLVSACSNPSIVRKPASSAIEEARLNTALIKKMPMNEFVVRVGDTLRVVRDADERHLERGNNIRLLLFLVHTDGTFNYPYAGSIKSSGKTVAEIQSDLTHKLSNTYKEPKVTVNIVKAAGNKFFIGGAVARPSAYVIDSPTTIGQAILQAGGVLTTADSENIALLRLDKKGHYQVYFIDYANMLVMASMSHENVILQRGDMVYVPKSGIGNAIDNVDMYLNKLIPFTKGVGFNYELNRP